MRRVLLYAMVAVSFAYLPALAPAQNFPDVPQGHRAYQALQVLKDNGLLVGYPGGEFRGYRPLSRYEFAVAMNAAYKKLMTDMSDSTARADDLAAKIKEIQDKLDSGAPPSGDNGGLQGDLDALKAQLSSLRSQVAGNKNLRAEIDALQRMSAEFEKELAGLGVDMGDMKKNLAALSDRVSALEKGGASWEWHGDFLGAAIGRHSVDHFQGVDWTGNPVGTDATGKRVGLDKDNELAHEIGLKVEGKMGEKVNFHTDLVFGNLHDYEFGSMTEPNPGARKSAAVTDVFVNRAFADFDTPLLGNNATIQIGRIGQKVAPLMMQRVDVDPYIDSERWDNGEFGLDGAKIGLNFSTVKLDVFAGRQANRGSVKSSSVYSVMVGDNRTIFDHAGRPAGINQGQMEVNTELGANLGMNFAGNGRFNLGYLVFDGGETTAPASLANAGFTFNRVAVLGGGLNMGFGESMFLTGNFAQAQMFHNGSSRLNKDNFAYNIGLNLIKGEQYNFGITFREVRPFFSAPGDWGRIGFWYNPTDIRGITLGGNYQFTPTVDVTLSGEVYQGTGRARDSAGTTVGLSSDDKINRLQLGVGYKLTQRWKMMVGWEGVYWDLKARSAGFNNTSLPPFLGGKPTESYYSLGFNYNFSAKSGLKLLYQLSDYDAKGLSGFNTPGNPDTKAKGGLLVTQFSVEF